MNRARRGFSLSELLVVIGIIGLLIAILLPTLSRVRKMARSTACLANLQQWGSSYQMYLNNNRGRSFADHRDLTDLCWWELLQPYNGDLRRTLLCPEATVPGNMMGSATKAWGPTRTYVVAAPKWIARGEFVGSYGFNAWLFREDRAKVAPPFSDRLIELPTNHPDRVPVLGDCIQDWASPTDADVMPRNFQNPIPFWSGTGPKPWGPAGMMAYFCIDRHDRAINVVFLDGHAEPVRLADLWKLKWNNAFTPREVVIPP